LPGKQFLVRNVQKVGNIITLVNGLSLGRM